MIGARQIFCEAADRSAEHGATGAGHPTAPISFELLGRQKAPVSYCTHNVNGNVSVIFCMCYLHRRRKN